MKSDKDIPPILKTPITLTIEALWAFVFLRLVGPDAIRENEKLQVAAHDFLEQFAIRIAAACAHFGIELDQLGVNFWPVARSIVHSFPEAFRAVEQGQKPRPRKNGTAWTAHKKLELLHFVDAMVEAGTSEKQACAFYGLISNPELNHDNVIQRHQEAKKWRKNLSTFDQMEVLREALRRSDGRST